MSQRYQLMPDKSYFTINMPSSDSIYVIEGTVRIFVRKRFGGIVKSTQCIAEVACHRYFPCFSYKESDGTQWWFDVKAINGHAVIEHRENSATRFMKSNFLRENNIPVYQQESFEGSILNWVFEQELKDMLMIVNSERGQIESEKKGIEQIHEAFLPSDFALPTNDTTNSSYRALAYLCRLEKIELATEKQLRDSYGANATVAEIATISGFICREVVLDDDWFRNDCGCLVATIDGRTVACYPQRTGRYRIYYPDTSTEEKLTVAIARKISGNAFCIGRALPPKPLSSAMLRQFVLRSLRSTDIASIAILGLVATAIGLLLPTLNQQIYDDYIPLADINAMVQFVVVIATFMIGNIFFSLVKSMTEFCVSSHISNDLQSAVYHRIFYLPDSFFRRIDSADLAQRIGSVKSIATTCANAIIVTGLTTLFSLVYLFPMMKNSKKLTAISIIMIFVYALIAFFVATRTLLHKRKIVELDGEAASKLYQYLGGIDKLRMAGSEERAQYNYVAPFSQSQAQAIKQNRISAGGAIISGSLSTIFSMFLYYLVIHDKFELSVGAFMAFNTAFGSFSAGMFSLIDEGAKLYELKPILKRLKPIMEIGTEDYDSTGDRIPLDMQGGIALDHLSFGYTEDVDVLKNLSLTISPGEYVGIAGASGCGKSTLLKLLLGFEKPSSGHIYYDSYDLEQLNKRALRKKLGVVLQNGDLISGSILENVTLTNRRATMNDVNNVLEQVGLKQDINEMPMGIHTMVSEGGGTLSGGQVQRILIAKALLGNPKILLFDEATSALDNVTQRLVCESLDSMHITRIVIAHRLSTIEKCTRIIYLKDGSIIEEGTYTELMSKHGEFYQMAQRQLVEQEGSHE